MRWQHLLPSTYVTNICLHAVVHNRLWRGATFLHCVCSVAFEEHVWGDSDTIYRWTTCTAYLIVFKIIVNGESHVLYLILVCLLISCSSLWLLPLDLLTPVQQVVAVCFQCSSSDQSHTYTYAAADIKWISVQITVQIKLLMLAVCAACTVIQMLHWLSNTSKTK